MSSGKVKCTCGWSWNKSDSSKKDMYICHECGRDNSNNMKNGGWLDNYNDSQASAPEGMIGDGYSNVGRNSSPAWGGQFQIGGSVYPVNYVPEAQTGGSFPGATGFSYARTGSIPSKGPRRNKTDKTDASAQNGKEMQYYQEGLDWQPKTISKNGAWLDSYDKAQGGTNLPSVRDLITDTTNRKIQAHKGKGKDTAVTKKDNTKTVTPKEFKKLSGRQQNELAKKQSEEQARKDWVQGSMEEAYKSPLMSPGYFTPEGVAIGALQGATKMGPDLHEGNYKGAAMDALMMLPLAPSAIKTATPLIQKAGKALGTEEGLLSNAYKYNPLAFKPNPEAYYHRSPNIENIINKEKQILQGFGESEVGKALTEKALRPTKGINLMKGANSQLYFAKGVPLDYGRTNKIIDYKTGNLIAGHGYPGPYIAEVKSVPMGASTKGKPPGADVTNIGGYAVPRRPINVNEAKFYKQHWLQGYKEVPKQNSVQPSFIKQDLSEGNDIKYSFTNDQGNNIGTFSGTKSPKGIYVNGIEVNPEFRRQGVASDIYKNIARELQSKNEGTLFSRSGQHQFTAKDELGRSVAPANKLWENLVNKGEAEKFVEGMSHSYRMKPLKQGGIIKDDRGQWDHPGEITEIGSNQITMQGVPYPVLGVSDTGDTQMMYPEEEYEFDGEKVTEYPMAKNGLRQEQKGLQNLDNLTNFTNYNKPQPGGWLNKYN